MGCLISSSSKNNAIITIPDSIGIIETNSNVKKQETDEIIEWFNKPNLNEYIKLLDKVPQHNNQSNESNNIEYMILN